MPLVSGSYPSEPSSGLSQMSLWADRRRCTSSALSCAGSPRSQPSLTMITTAPCPSTRRAQWRLKSPSASPMRVPPRSEEHTSELQSLTNLVCRLLLEKKKQKNQILTSPLQRQHRVHHSTC